MVVSTLAQNSAARGEARKAGIPIVNAQPAALLPTPGVQAPTVDLSTRTITSGTPVNSRAAQEIVDQQNATHIAALNKPSEVTTFNSAAANLMSAYDPKTLNTYVTQGKVTQEQADAIVKAGGLTPDLAIKLGLGKTMTVQGQLGLQKLTKSNLETRLKEAKADLDAGYIDQTKYNDIEKSTREGLTDTDRLIGELQNPYLAKTASGEQTDRLAQIDQQLGELNQPVNFDGLYSYLDHTQAAKLMADREASKAALIREKAAILEKKKAGNTNTQAYGTAPAPGAGPATTAASTAASRMAAVQGLVSQGVTDPAQMLNYLNYAQDGTKIGDFTIEEVQRLLQGGGQSRQVTPITQSMIEGMIGKVDPAQAKFLEGALGMLQGRMAESQQEFSDDKAQADYELSQFKEIANDMLTRADSVKDISTQLAKRQQADDEAAAAAAKAAELAKNETERQMTAIKLNEQRRQLELSNSKKINSMTNRLAIAGGFGSMGGIKAIEDAQSEGDQMVARFVNDIALTDQQYLDRAVQISSNYTSAISQIHRTYGDQMLNIVTKYNDRVDEVQKLLFGSMQKRNEAVQTAKNRMRDSVNKLHDTTLILMQNAVKDSQDQQRHIADQIHADKRSDKTLEYQERMANKRLKLQLNREDQRAAAVEVKAEQTEAKQVRAQFNTIAGRQAVQDYQVLRDTQARAANVLQRALDSKDPMVIGAAKEAVTVLRAKGLDPTTGVREQEFTRAGYSQSWIDRSKQVFNAMAGGDMTGITTDMVKDFVKSMEVMSTTQKQAALAEYTPAINYLMDFNTRSNNTNIDPRTVVPQEFLDDTVLKSYFQDEKAPTYNFNYGAYSGTPGEATEEDPKIVTPLTKSLMDTGLSMDQIYGDYSGLQFFSTEESRKVQEGTGSIGDIISTLGPVTQGFDTPISTKNYSPKTVAAWGGKHDGIDLALPEGSFVPSFSGGSLISVAYGKEGWGLTAIIRDDDGAEHRYSHLESIDPFLKVGDRIEKGMEFAQVGHTGNVFSTSGGNGAHLDYRIKKDGKYIDPYSYYS